MRSKRILLALVVTLLLAGRAEAQRARAKHAHPHHRRGGKVVVVKRSSYRPGKVVVFHPVWRPKWTCHRRWVFFPLYNIYWDNWRNHYLYWNGAAWVSQSSPPPAVANVDLSEAKHYELKESDDDNDEIAAANEGHKQEYKAD